MQNKTLTIVGAILVIILVLVGGLYITNPELFKGSTTEEPMDFLQDTWEQTESAMDNIGNTAYEGGDYEVPQGEPTKRDEDYYISQYGDINQAYEDCMDSAKQNWIPPALFGYLPDYESLRDLIIAWGDAFNTKPANANVLNFTLQQTPKVTSAEYSFDPASALNRGFVNGTEIQIETQWAGIDDFYSNYDPRNDLALDKYPSAVEDLTKFWQSESEYEATLHSLSGAVDDMQRHQAPSELDDALDYDAGPDVGNLMEKSKPSSDYDYDGSESQ